jgi:hypothetical protein
MANTDARLKALEQRMGRGAQVCHVIDVTQDPQAAAQQRIAERQAEIARSGSTAPLIIIGF